MQRRSFLLGVLGVAAAASIRAAKSLGTIAYVEFGGLTVRTLPGGEPRKVLDSAVSFPRLSPSGKWILYTQNDTAYVVSLDGKKVHRVGDAAAWSPVADELWVRNETSDRLDRFSPRNDWSSALDTLPEGTNGVLSPDGSEMIYAKYLSGGVDDSLQSTALTRVNWKGQAEEKVVVTGGGDWEPCLWTRDGKSLIYWAQEEFSASEASDGNKLFIVPASGGKGRELGVITLLASDSVAQSPTRNELAVTDGEGRYEWKDKRLAVVDLETFEVRYLTPENLVAFSPAWSPDGNLIAYSAGPEPKSKDESEDMLAGLDGGKSLNALFAKRRIWIVDRMGAQPPRLLTSNDGYHDEQPLWSAEGTHILFTRSDQSFNDIESMTSDNQSLWLVGADGSDPVQVTGPLYVEPDAGGPEMRRSAFDWLR